MTSSIQIKNQETKRASPNQTDTAKTAIEQALIDAESGLDCQATSLEAVKLSMAKKSEESDEDIIYI